MPDRRPDDMMLVREGAEAFHPAIDYGEESLDQYVQRLGLAVGHLSALIEQARAAERRLPIDLTEFEQTDSSGNATFQVYQVGAGFLFELEYVVVECATFDAASPRTPAAPFTSAACWLGLFQSTNPIAVSQGEMIDFTPTTAGAQAIPNVAEYDPPRVIRSQQFLVCKVVSGPTSQRLSVHFGGHLRANG